MFNSKPTTTSQIIKKLVAMSDDLDNVVEYQEVVVQRQEDIIARAELSRDNAVEDSEHAKRVRDKINDLIS